MPDSEQTSVDATGGQLHSRHPEICASRPMSPFSAAFTTQTQSLLLQTETGTASIQGYDLTISTLVAKISKSRITILLKTANINEVQKARVAFNDVFTSGATIYGVNTGFGGSAGARTIHHEQLQVALVQMLNSASYPIKSTPRHSQTQEGNLNNWLVGEDNSNGDNMPTKWVRAAMLVRANTLLRGHSGVSQEVVTGILELLNAGITPVVPMRGSISASGDLSPLSFVASTLQGNPTTMVYDHSDLENVCIVSADEALQQIGMSPLAYGPKEALALVNGTAFSDAVGALVAHDAMVLTALSQLLTAMGVEAMCGHVESFDHFIAEIKNDDQQAEIARNIRGFLNGSNLVKGLETSSLDHDHVQDVTVRGTIIDRGQQLAQDRYALRTSSQWLSPPIKDVLLAYNQVQQCLNSTTDNPIVDARDASSPRVLNGGNFQGSTCAGAMDKTRSAMQLIGKLMFAQCTELINPATNNGLPANLAATDPSMDYCCKGLDINIAAYCSELGWLANAIGPHVQSAEMHNQAVNSLALISARKTSEAITVLQKLMASNLYILCQALDVRVMQERFLETAKANLDDLARQMEIDEKLACQLWAAVKNSWEHTGTFDLVDRVDKAMAAASPPLLAALIHHLNAESCNGLGGRFRGLSILCVEKWQQLGKSRFMYDYKAVRAMHFEDYAVETPKFLATHTAAMYNFVRKDLGVPMFQGLGDNPTRENRKLSIGGYVGVIETALKHCEIMEVLGKAIRDVAGIDATFPSEECQVPGDEELH